MIVFYGHLSFTLMELVDFYNNHGVRALCAAVEVIVQ